MEISIIIPVYNAQKYIKKCIESIKNQTFKDIDIILIDDGSTDNSGSICDEYAMQDSRIRVFHKENGGVSSARNLGIEKAIGDYIMFVDADDYLKQNCLEECIKIITAYNKIDVLKFNFIKKTDHIEFKHSFNINTNYLYVYNDYIKLYECVFLHDDLCPVWAALFKRELVKNLKFDESIKLGEDFKFFIQALLVSNNIYVDDNAYYYYYVNHNSATHYFDINKKIKLLEDGISVNKYIENVISSNISKKVSRRDKSYRNIHNSILSCISNCNYGIYLNYLDMIFNDSIINDEIISLHLPIKRISKLQFYCIKIAQRLKKVLTN